MNRILKRTVALIFLILLSFLFGSCTIDIDPSIANTAFGMQALRYEYFVVLLSLLGGMGCLIASVILTLLGFSGGIEWFVEAADFTSRLTNASPGIVLMAVGFWLTLKSRLKVKVKKRNSK